MKLEDLRDVAFRRDLLTSPSERHLAMDALLAIAEYRNAVCSTQYDQHADSEHCNGENHVESCPVEVARQGLIAVDDKREAL